MKRYLIPSLVAFGTLRATLVLAGEMEKGVASSKIDSGDTAWMLASAALVMLMTPGLALFYGGMVRTKNVVGEIGLKVSSEEEESGLDLSQHNETGYNL